MNSVMTSISWQHYALQDEFLITVMSLYNYLGLLCQIIASVGCVAHKNLKRCS